jgi:hypothetical protein
MTKMQGIGLKIFLPPEAVKHLLKMTDQERDVFVRRAIENEIERAQVLVPYPPDESGKPS